MPKFQKVSENKGVNLMDSVPFVPALPMNSVLDQQYLALQLGDYDVISHHGYVRNLEQPIVIY